MAARSSKTATRSAKVTKASGAPVSRAGKVVGKPSAAATPRPLSQQYLRLGPQNPAGVSAIMREADTGYMWRLCDLLEEFRHKDSHLQTVVGRRERALANLPYQLIPASEKRRDLKIAAWVEGAIRQMGSTAAFGMELRSFSDALVHLNAAVIHGYGAGECPWGRDGRYIRPLGFLPMAPRRFIYSQIDASLRWYDVSGPLTPYPGVDLLRDWPEGRAIVHQPRINGAAVGSREGLARPLIWAALFRNWTITDWHRLAELAWKPYRIGTYLKDKVVHPDTEILEEALALLTATGFAAIPDSVSIEMSYAKNRGAGMEGLHGGLAEFLAGEMSKVTLGSTLTVEQGKVGTQALGSVHQDVTQETRDADARSVEATIQRQLIAPMVRYNFGNVPVPTFRFVTEEGADLSALADALAKLGKLRLQIPAKWVRATFGIPEPEIGEELMDGAVREDPAEAAKKAAEAAAAAAAQQPVMTPDKAPKKEPGIEVKPADEEDGPDVSDQEMAKAYRNFAVHQILTLAGVRKPMNENRMRVA